MLTATIAALKISFAAFGMISSSASGCNKTRPTIGAQKIGLRCRKFHHAFLKVTQRRHCVIALRDTTASH
jgi:hypothetical protein